MSKLLPFLIIVFIAIVTRFVGLGEVPPSLNWDEVSHGYNAYSILKTGHDEWGNFMPTIFRAYGDYKLPVYIYLTAVSEFFFELNYFSVRLVSVLAGIGSVVFTYLLVRKNFTNNNVALLSALLMAISPWSLFVSRAAFEANLALFFIISGAYFLSSKKFIISAILFGLSVWTYNSARIFVPLLLFSTFIVYRKNIKPVFWIIAALFIVPMLYQLFNPVGQARYSNLQILDEGAIAYIEEQRNTTTIPDPISKTIYNRPVYFLSRVTENYLNHFSPQYLFFEGSSDYQFNVPEHGLIFWILIPFFYVGIVIAVKNIKEKKYLFILMWLLLAPIASSLTKESPHVLRSLVMLPIPFLLISIALVRTVKSKTLIFVLLVFIFIQFGVYVQKYKTTYRENYSWSWQYGYEEMVNYIESNYDNYDYIVITKKYGEPHEFILFYLQWDPDKYRQDPNLVRYEQSNWYWVDRFDKFYFVNDWEVPSEGNQFVTESGLTLNCNEVKCLLITSPSNVPEGWVKVDEIRFLNNEQVFEIYEN